jgi:polysaccharide export outer membrane protein
LWCPGAGARRPRGRTVEQVQANITNAIAPNFASPPTVFVSVRPAPEEPQIPGAQVPVPEDTITIYVMGEVGAPGPKQLLPGTTFLQAMAQTGGLTNFAARKRIQLRRNLPGGQPVVYTFDYKAISRGGTLSQDPVLIEGDVILVPERRLFE